MPGKKISLLSSNYFTNNTCHFGSMAGLAPTTNVRPHITGLHGYKYLSVAANGVNWITGAHLDKAKFDAGCGLSKNCNDGKKCLKHLNMWYRKDVYNRGYYTPHQKYL